MITKLNIRRFRAAISPVAIFAVSALMLSFPAAVSAASEQVFDSVVWEPGEPGAAEMSRFTPFGDTSGLSFAVGDMGSDGMDEIIVGSPPGEEPMVRVLRTDGSEIYEFSVYDSGMKQGVNVAVGDIDGDGANEIVTGTGPGALAHVLVLDSRGNQKAYPGGFMAYDNGFRGGVTVALGDIDGDNRDEIITGAGPGGGPHVRIWKGDGSGMAGEFFAYGHDRFEGINVAAGELDGDGKDEIVTALSGNSAEIRIFWSNLGLLKGVFPGIAGGFNGGLQVSVADTDGWGHEEIIVAPNGKGGPHVHVLDMSGNLKESFFAREEPYRDGTAVGAGRFGDAGPSFVTMSVAKKSVSQRPHLEKFIRIDVSEQRLVAHEYGSETNSFFVSTGLRTSPTPVGEFEVTAKPEEVHYQWNYGPDNPENYDLGKVPYNVRFLPHYYIHYAPWHNNFGRRMSHGCVNAARDDAKWIYEWAEIGVPVLIEE